MESRTLVVWDQRSAHKERYSTCSWSRPSSIRSLTPWTAAVATSQTASQINALPQSRGLVSQTRRDLVLSFIYPLARTLLSSSPTNADRILSPEGSDSSQCIASHHALSSVLANATQRVETMQCHIANGSHRYTCLELWLINVVYPDSGPITSKHASPYGRQLLSLHL